MPLPWWVCVVFARVSAWRRPACRRPGWPRGPAPALPEEAWALRRRRVAPAGHCRAAPSARDACDVAGVVISGAVFASGPRSPPPCPLPPPPPFFSPPQLRVPPGPRSSSRGMCPGPSNWMHDMTYGLGPSSCVAEVSGPHAGQTASALRAGQGVMSLAR